MGEAAAEAIGEFQDEMWHYWSQLQNSHYHQ